MRFVSTESTFTYFELTKSYVLKYGKPIAFYSDRLGIFRVNSKEAKGGDGTTQFGRALNDLNIEIINAHSPEAKGRVERANRTLQNRFIKEMRLKGISNMQEGNAYIPEFMKDYNKRLAKKLLAIRMRIGLFKITKKKIWRIFFVGRKIVPFRII